MAIQGVGSTSRTIYVDPFSEEGKLTEVERLNPSYSGVPVSPTSAFSPNANRALYGQVKIFANSGAKDGPQYDEDQIEEQIELLEDRETREEAKNTLLEMGPAAVPALIEELQDDWEYGHAISDVLVRMGPAAIPTLIETLNSIADIYEEDGDITGTPAVQIGYRSVKILGDMGPAAVSAMPTLIRALGVWSGHPSIGDEAATALSQMGSAAIEPLIEALKNGNDFAKFNAARALVRMGSAAVVAIPALIEALKNGDDSTKENAAVALAGIGPAARDAVPALAEMLANTSSYNVRITIIGALGRIGPDARDTVPLLTEMLVDTSEHNITMAIIAALGRIGPDAASAVPALLQALQTKVDNPLDILVVVEALGRIGSSPETVVPALGDLLRGDRLGTYLPAKNTVYRALSSFGPAAIPVLIERIGAHSAELLGNLGPAAEAAIPALIEALEYDSPITIMNPYYSPLGTPVLQTIAERGDGELGVSEIAATALVRIGPAAIPALIEALGNTEGEAMNLAIGALILLGEDARTALFEALRNENIEIRRGASAVLLAIDADTESERTQ